MAWKARKDPLFRGDEQDAVRRSVPSADPNIVRHVLFLEGSGRDTPYLSMSESRKTAATFAGRNGRVWETDSPRVKAAGVGHFSQQSLRGPLRGQGKGRAAWPSAYEVARARHYVEQHQEHLLDFQPLENDEALRLALETVFGEVE